MMNSIYLVHQGDTAHKPTFPNQRSSGNKSQGTARVEERVCVQPRKNGSEKDESCF